jgi:hypothetical protein
MRANTNFIFIEHLPNFGITALFWSLIKQKYVVNRNCAHG